MKNSHEPKSNRNRVSNSDALFYSSMDYLLIIITALSVLIFILFPILTVLYKSFFPGGSFTLELYDGLFYKNKNLIFNSLLSSGLSTLFSTLLAIAVAAFTSFSKPLIKKAVTFILLLSMISPPFVSSLAYIQLFGRRGLITYYFLRLNIDPYGLQGIVMMQTLSMTALNSLVLIAVISGIDKTLLSASQDLGSSANYTVRKILLPLMKPGIIVCSLLTFIRCISDFGTPMIIGGSFNVVATEIYMQIIGYGDLGYASSMNALMLLPSLLLFLVYRHYMKISAVYSSGGSKQGSSSEFELSLKIKICLGFISTMFFIIMLMQYISIFISGFSKYSYGKFLWTFDNIASLQLYDGSSFTRSIVYAFITGIVGSLLGALISYYADRRKILGMKVVDMIATLPYIVPGIFFGIGYILAFNDYPIALTGTASIVVLNCIFKQLPMSTKVSSAALSQINSDIEDSAKDLGAKNIFVMKDIVIPNLVPAFLVSFVNNFTATMTTIGAIIFLIYPGQKVATLELFDSITSGSYGTASLIASILICITLAFNILFSKFILGWSDIKSVSAIKEAN